MKIFWDQPPTRPWMSIILILLDFWLILTSYSWFKYLNGFILWLLCVVWLVVVLSTINYCNWTFSGLLGPCIKHISAKNGDFRTKMPLIGDYHHIMVSPYLDSFVHVSHGPLKRFWRWALATDHTGTTAHWALDAWYLVLCQIADHLLLVWNDSRPFI